MSRSATPLAYVYLDGPEVYVHPATVRPATATDLHYAPTCITECEEPILVGQMIIVTDAHVEGEATAHLGCLLATSGMLVTLEEGERLQAEADRPSRATY